MAVPFLLLYGIGIPALFAFLILRNHSKGSGERFRYFLSFAYENYRPSRAWYELVWLLRRFFLALCATFLPQALKSIGIIALLAAAIALNLVLRPFRDERDNWLDVGSMGVLLLTQSQLMTREVFSTGAASLALFYIGAWRWQERGCLFHTLENSVSPQRCICGVGVGSDVSSRVSSRQLATTCETSCLGLSSRWHEHISATSVEHHRRWQ